MKRNIAGVILLIVLICSVSGSAEDRLTVNMGVGTRAMPVAIEVEKEFESNISLFTALAVTKQSYDVAVGMRYYFHESGKSGFFISGSGSLLYVLSNARDVIFAVPFFHGGVGYEQRFGRWHLRLDGGVAYVSSMRFMPDLNVGVGYDLW